MNKFIINNVAFSWQREFSADSAAELKSKFLSLRQEFISTYGAVALARKGHTSLDLILIIVEPGGAKNPRIGMALYIDYIARNHGVRVSDYGVKIDGLDAIVNHQSDFFALWSATGRYNWHLEQIRGLSRNISTSLKSNKKSKSSNKIYLVENN